MDNEQRSSNSSDLTSSSQDMPLETARTEAGGEASRLCVGPVRIKDFMRITFRRQFKDVVQDVPQVIAPETRDKVSDLLHGVPTGPGAELQMYSPLKEAMNEMCSSLWGGNPPVEFETVSHSKDAKDPGSPDLVIKAHDSGKCAWPCALAFVEVKPEEKQDPFYNADSRSKTPHQYQTQVWNQISHYATVSFKRRPRCFLCGIGVFGSYARFFRWDRSSVLVSMPFDYKVNPKPLWQFLAGFGAAGFSGSGVDPSIDFEFHPAHHVELLREKIRKAREKRLISEEAEMLDDDSLVAQSSTITVLSKSGDKVEKYITVGPPLFTSTAMLGRGTCTWLAFPVPGTVENPERSNEDHLVIIKDSWRDPSRRLEGEIYEIIHAEGLVPGVARLRSDMDMVDMPDPNKGMHRTIAHLLNKHYGPRKCPPRVHHRCVLDSVGIPLSRFSSTRQAMEAIYDCILGHESMGKKDILHRDISINNIMISAYPDKEKCKGFLIDMEYATVVGEPGSDGDLREITGTLQFLSTTRVREPGLDLPIHKTWNDLESFFWSIVYLFAHHRPNTMSDEWIVHIFVSADRSRRIHFFLEHVKNVKILCDNPGHTEGGTNGEGPTGNALIHIPLTSCIHNISDLIASHHPHPVYYAQLHEVKPELFSQLDTHEYIKRVIREALDSDGWPDSHDGSTPKRRISPPKKAVLDITASNLTTGIESTPASGSKRKRHDNSDEDKSIKRARHGKMDGNGHVEEGYLADSDEEGELPSDLE